ncbi:Uncharacterized protein Adt_02730 [Abeliophyllum distichum]|uniref:Reverse transcriptase domain-containing protein n=1 Tax=Abeliophyllum distichum TaxID=126358 RepID=A0ABD1VWH6_9LAMI
MNYQMYFGKITPPLGASGRNTVQTIFWNGSNNVEVVNPTLRMQIEQTDNNITRVEINLLEKVRERAAIKTMAYKRKAAKYFDHRVKSRSFQPHDLVLKSSAAAGHPPSKLKPN